MTFLFATLLAVITPNQFPDMKSDSAAIQAAVDLAVSRGEPVTIPAWNERAQTNVWMISETILLPSGATVYLDNCRLRMADRVFCNCFANRNAWAPGRLDPANEETEIRLIGRGHAVLDGGEFNGWGERAVPGGTFQEDVHAHIAKLPKRLIHNSPIYFHNVRRFEVSGLHVYHQRYWGMCYSFCSEGEVRNIRFESDLSWIGDDGKTRDPNRRPNASEYKNLWVKNSDGVDIRRGCHDILIENISGFTEDDTVALTNLPLNGDQVDEVKGLCTDIHHITIRNVRAATWRWMNLVRLLSTDGAKIHDVTLDGIYETRLPGMDWRAASAVQINDSRDEYRHKCHPVMGDTRNISIRNVFSCSGAAVRIFETAENLDIENVHVTDGAEAAILVQDHTTFKNCSIRGIHATPTAKIRAILDLHTAHGDLSVSDIFADNAENVLRLSDSDIAVTLANDHVAKLSGERIARAAKGTKECGPRWPDTEYGGE